MHQCDVWAFSLRSLFASAHCLRLQAEMLECNRRKLATIFKTHYEFGNEYQDTWGNREKLIFTLVMTKVFPLFRVLLMFAFLLWSSGLQQHTAQPTMCLSTSQEKVWFTVFILSVEPFYAVMMCTFTAMETSNLKPQILNHTLIF